MADRITVRTAARCVLVDITDQISGYVRDHGLDDGTLTLWSLHTTCALTVNEGYDPDVATDVSAFLSRLVPQNAEFRHSEGNSDAHIKTSLFGPGLTLIVEHGDILLGRWQRVYLAEFDGPRTREVAVHARLTR
jgi:secondary thiamine-phosphate synthase enzyme